MLTGVYAVHNLLLSMTQVESNLVVHNWAKLAAPLLLLMGVSIAWVVNGSNVELVLWIQLSSLSIVAILIAKWLLKNVGNFPGGSKSPNDEFLKSFYQFSKSAIKFHSTVVLGLVLVNVDKLYLYFFGALKDFGVYSVAFSASRLIGVLQETLATTLFSKLAGRVAVHGEGGIQQAFRMTFLPMMICAILVGILANGLFGVVFGAEFKGAGIVFLILAVEAVLGGASWLLAQEFNVIGKPGLVFYRQAISAVPVIALLPFVPSEDPLIWIALLLLLGALIRLLVTLFMYAYAFGEKVPKVLPKKSDWNLVVNSLRNFVFESKKGKV